MSCLIALEIVKYYLKILVRGEKIMIGTGKAEKAFQHLRKCRRKKCSQLREELEGVIKTIESVKLFFDNEESLGRY